MAPSRILLTAVSLFLLSAPLPAQAQAGRPSQADMDGLRALVVAYETAMNKRDAEAMTATFAATADIIFFDQPRRSGREAIRADAAQALANWPASQRFNLRITDARLLAPDIAIVETDATFTGADDMANRGTIVAVRDGGRWLIAALRVYPRLIGGGQE